MAEVIFTDDNFDKEVLKSGTPVVVDFWADWCAPCRIVSPVIEELARDFEGKVKIGKLNVDQNSTTAQKFGIMSIPTVLVFKKGEVVKTLVGAQSKDNYKNEIEQLIT